MIPVEHPAQKPVAIERLTTTPVLISVLRAVFVLTTKSYQEGAVSIGLSADAHYRMEHMYQ